MRILGRWPAVPRRFQLRFEIIMKILFTFENPLPNAEADAEVFITTAQHVGRLSTQSWLHVPADGEAGREAAEALSGMPAVPAFAPLRPAALRHFSCGLTLPFRGVFP